MTERKKLIQQLEEKIRETIHAFVPIQGIPELDYCQIVAEALDLIHDGIFMRIEELEEDGED